MPGSRPEYDDQIESAGGKFTARAIAATGSTEYHKRVARRGLDSILADLSTLEGSPKMSRQDKIVAWTRLAADMMNPAFWQAVDALHQRKVVSGELNGIKEAFLENHVMWARTVLERVVVPNGPDIQTVASRPTSACSRRRPVRSCAAAAEAQALARLARLEEPRESD